MRETGTYVDTIADGAACRAFVPYGLPPEPAIEMTPGLQHAFDSAHLALGRLDGISGMLPESALFLYSYVRKEAVLSSQIEGTQSTLDDLLMYEMDAQPGVPLDDVEEVSSYVRALYRGMERLEEGLPVSRRLILELHSLLLSSGRGTDRAPGTFRRTQNWIGGRRPENASHIPPPWNMLDDCWSDLEKFINDIPRPVPPLLKAALAHVQFETIHPFLDGNGRVGRLLITMILLAAGVIRQPLLYLSLYFRIHRSEYYDRLQRVRTLGDWAGWLLYFAEAVRATAEQAVRTAMELTELRKNDRERIQTLGRVSGSALRVHDAMFARPLGSIQSLQESTGLTQMTIGNALHQLETRLGIVREVTGRQRGRVFAYTDYVAILNKELTAL